MTVFVKASLAVIGLDCAMWADGNACAGALPISNASITRPRTTMKLPHLNVILSGCSP
jgi:hypothetical protein